MKNFIRITKNTLMLLLVTVYLVGCNTNAPENTDSSEGNNSSKKISLSVSPTKLTTHGFYMRSEYIEVKCNTNWDVRIENTDMFYSVNPRYNGSGNGTIVVTFPEINAQMQRSFTTQYGSITISCKDENMRTISQKVECVRQRY